MCIRLKMDFHFLKSGQAIENYPMSRKADEQMFCAWSFLGASPQHHCIVSTETFVKCA